MRGGHPRSSRVSGERYNRSLPLPASAPSVGGAAPDLSRAPRKACVRDHHHVRDSSGRSLAWLPWWSVPWRRKYSQIRAKGTTVSEQQLSLIHISEPTRQAEISYAVFCLKKKKK